MKNNDISRFSEMYDQYYGQAAEELRRGRKTSHWMWFIFPQIQGLGRSEMSRFYAVRDLDEARAFLDSPCGEKMRSLLGILLGLRENDPEAVFGYIDAVKLASSMTLFAEAAPDDPVFRQVLDKFYQGRPDEKTLEILNIRLPDGPVRHDAGKPEIHMKNASPDFRSCPGLSGKPRC